MPDLGTKYDCHNCGAKFYDLGRPEPVCPKCGANQKDAKRPDPTAEAASSKRRRREEVPRPVEEVEVDLVETSDDDFGDDDLETPEGVEETEEDFDDDDDE